MTEIPPDPLRPHEEAVIPPEEFDARIWFIGRIHTPWARHEDRPKHGNPVAGPECRIEVFDPWMPALAGVECWDRLQILYWMHRARRDEVRQNPNFGAASVGTFAPRSPLQPDPIASSVVRLMAIDSDPHHARS